MIPEKEVWESAIDDLIAELREHGFDGELAFLLPSGIDFWPDHAYKGCTIFNHEQVPPDQAVGGTLAQIKVKIAELYNAN